MPYRGNPFAPIERGLTQIGTGLGQRAERKRREKEEEEKRKQQERERLARLAEYDRLAGEGGANPFERSNFRQQMENIPDDMLKSSFSSMMKSSAAKRKKADKKAAAPGKVARQWMGTSKAYDRGTQAAADLGWKPDSTAARNIAGKAAASAFPEGQRPWTPTMGQIQQMPGVPEKPKEPKKPPVNPDNAIIDKMYSKKIAQIKAGININSAELRPQFEQQAMQSVGSYQDYEQKMIQALVGTGENISSRLIEMSQSQWQQDYKKLVENEMKGAAATMRGSQLNQVYDEWQQVLQGRLSGGDNTAAMMMIEQLEEKVKMLLEDVNEEKRMIGELR